MMLSGLERNALPVRVSTGWILIAGRVKSSVVVAPTEEDWNALPSKVQQQCLIGDILNNDMRSGLECFACKGLYVVSILIAGRIESFACKGLHRLDFDCWGVKNSVVAPTEEGRVIDCEDLFILTIDAGLSQCLIVDILNDVMRSGLECFVCKGLHRLDFDSWEECRVSDREDLFILTIAAGLSQCLIVDILNDVMWSGSECFACKGLHRLDFDCWEGEKFSCGPY
eukprot:scaffold131539_cov43-Cyclotella_meneghiniana.AAC.4